MTAPQTNMNYEKKVFLILNTQRYKKCNNATKYDAVCSGLIVSLFKMATFLNTRFIMSAELIRIMYGKNKLILTK